ncbi:uncharacterized protein LOC131674297 [Phymastichus coffea]|uniref:uncharacterized protein LOC131674297 n=1 Tax=Phymastichus coffea TaxID=108790 RepID=UPI00273CE6F7|nr:uncharacterized protein LOC131674297 [Phymastichus coffea]
MRLFLVFFAIFIVIKADGHLNLDSHELLKIVKQLCEDTLKVIEDVPDKIVELRKIIKIRSKSLPVSFSACEEVKKLRHEIEILSPKTIIPSKENVCDQVLNNNTVDLDTQFIKNVQQDLNWIANRLNSIIIQYKPMLITIKKKLENYTVKSESCKQDELNENTCGALLNYEKDIYKYRNKIDEYLSYGTNIAHFIGVYVEIAWQDASSLLNKYVISPVETCLSNAVSNDINIVLA